MANPHHIWTLHEEEELIRARIVVHPGRNKWHAIKNDPQFQIFNHMTIDALRSKFNSLKRSGRVPEIANGEANVVEGEYEGATWGQYVEANLQVANMGANANMEQMGEHSLVDDYLLLNAEFSSEEWFSFFENNEENNVNEAPAIHQPAGFCQGNNPV